MVVGGDRVSLKRGDHRSELSVELFFPILRRSHYFLLCFDFQRGRYEIIDSDSNPQAKAQKYGDCIEEMKVMLSAFCKVVAPGMSAAFVGLESKRLQMAWRDSKNQIDCGVFMMRHTETFLGQRVLDWDCGLVKGDSTILHKLRMRYMRELVLCEHNVHRSTNLSRAYQSISVPPSAV
ncbi:PREDICTED: uncharacterized protein LOC109153589 [Ipomoea nil]|uniref:uncharacterized protein LOC109153589 n=1 Tax=Ipomoea nil TaxID=35883 RepID=UPI000901C42C|nr:PREDICTED: uncharacterized protein LOC109153589 [Ipomoea nil]